MDSIPYKILKKIINKGNSIKMDIRARHHLLELNNDRVKKDKVKVCFIVQLPEIWDKEIDIYDEMKKRNNIQLVMYVVPPFDMSSKLITTNYDNNYFLKKYPEARRAIDKNGQYVDIKKERFDYVFFQRPYDYYLPQSLRSTELVKFTKCCYVPYGFAGADVFNGGNTNPDFFRNMYFVFLESDYMKSIFLKKYKYNSQKGIQHFEYLGYPSLEQYMGVPNREGEFNIMWTPRWSYDSVLGGSHFLEYKEGLLDLSDKFPQSKVIFRPHPLMFDEFINKQLMGREDVESYLSAIDQRDILLDKDRPIYNALVDTDVLITDYSSVIVMYFLTGRPIIYCPSQLKLNDIYIKIEEGMYIAKNWSEVEKYLYEINNGNDYLRENRQQIISKYFLNSKNSAKTIVDRILNDYFN